MGKLVKVTLRIKAEHDEYLDTIATEELHGFKTDFIRKAIDEAIKKDKRKRKGEKNDLVE